MQERLFLKLWSTNFMLKLHFLRKGMRISQKNVDFWETQTYLSILSFYLYIYSLIYPSIYLCLSIFQLICFCTYLSIYPYSSKTVPKRQICILEYTLIDSAQDNNSIVFVGHT